MTGEEWGKQGSQDLEFVIKQGIFELPGTLQGCGIMIGIS